MTRAWLASAKRWRPGARLSWILLIFLLGVTVAHAWMQVSAWPRSPRGTPIFYDFQVFLNSVRLLDDTGTIYPTQLPEYFAPGSSVYKYPPPFAAALRICVNLPPREVATIFLLANLGLLLGFVALLIHRTRPGPRRGLLIVLLAANWQPIWETLGGLQLEIAVLLLLTLTFLRTREREDFVAGIPIGVSGALKVYPWAILLYFLLRGRWRTLAGAAAGAIGTLAVACIVLPVRFTVEYFTRILPRLGGTAVSYENVSLMGNLNRLLLASHGALPAADQLRPLDLVPVVPPAVHDVRPALLLLSTAIAAAVLFVLVRAVRRAERESIPWRRPLAISLVLCAMLFLMPSSWLNYQTLLALPLLAAVARAADRWSWFLLLLAIGMGTINGDGGLFRAHATICSILRASLPLLLGAVWLRFLRLVPAPATPAGAPAAA